MVDFHTHILPGIDDGAPTLKKSIELITELKNQGISEIVYTPHFYPEQQNATSFFEERDKAVQFFEMAEIPTPYVGAELYYYKGISKSDELYRFRITGTDLVLLEMPFFEWSEAETEELFDLVATRENTYILAHIERYVFGASQKKAIEALKKMGAITQVNTSFVASPQTEKLALKLIKSGMVDILASDTHSIDTRPPMFTQSFKVIEEKLGKIYAERLKENSETILREHKV